VFEKVKRKIKKAKDALSGTSVNSTNNHQMNLNQAYTGVTQGHTHSMPGHSHTHSTAWPYDPSTGPLAETLEWFHKVFCPCGSIEWIEVGRKWAWSHIKNENIERKLVICKECEKVTIVDDDEIAEQRDPIDTDNKFEFYEKIQELRIEFEQSQFPRTTTTWSATSTTSTTSTTRPPGV
jgi:hypothetical protein